MNKLTTKQLIKQLSQMDQDAYIMLDDGKELRYLYRVEEDNALELSSDEVDVLSNYLDVHSMEEAYDYDQLDFFSIVVLGS